LIGCLSALFIFVILIICTYLCKRRDRSRIKLEKVSTKHEHVEMEGLLCVGDISIERQQSPVTYYPTSCPSTPPESDTGCKRSYSQLDLTSERKVSDYKRRQSLDIADFDLKLYESTPKNDIAPYHGLGRLSLSLTYNKQHEKLTVFVQQAENIQSKNIHAMPCPYLKVCLLPDKKRRMHSKTRKGENPTFNEDFVFSVPQSELPKRVLRIAVCDFDRFSRQNVLGYIVMSMQDHLECLLQNGGTEDMWIELSDNDALPGTNKGEIMFSLSYLPTAGRMTLTVISAKDLNVNKKDTGIAVKVNLILHGKVAKSKKTSVNKTDLKEPTFNESFVFDIINEMLDRTSFVVTVATYESSGKRVIGKATTGPYMYSTGTGLTQWNDMLLQPRKSVAHWHKLL